MKIKLLCTLIILFLSASGALAVIKQAFAPTTSIATVTGSWSLYKNPSGLAFLRESEATAAYLYEWERSSRHHGTLNFAINLWETLSLAVGINTRAAFDKESKRSIGTDLSGIFGLAFGLGSKCGIGLSLLKSHNFLRAKSTSTMVGFGLQSRLNRYLAVGALYQEVNDGYFKAPVLAAGLGIRPLGNAITLGIDTRLTPRGENFGDGFRVDPILSFKAQWSGLALNCGVEIPGIKQGWNKPIFSAGLDFNFAHVGISLEGLINSAEKNYGLGTSTRASHAEWTSLYDRRGLWVELSIDEDGTLSEHHQSLHPLFAKEYCPLSILAMLKRLKNDPMVEGLIINLRGFNFGDARAQEWRNALIALREAHKQIIVFLEAPSERDYYIATAAHKIYMNSKATLSLSRFQKTLVYFADLLDQIGIKAQAVSAGTYKTAPRVFTNSHASKEEIEIYSNILSDFYENFLKETAQARSLPKEKLREIFNAGEIKAPDALKLGLIDAALYQDEVKALLEESLHQPIDFFAHYSRRIFKNENWNAPKKVVVIPIDGEISDGHVHPSIVPIFGLKTGALDVVDEINDALKDNDVVGIIVRVNSPGGTASAGAKINRALLLAREQKPVVTSMADVAASAGYLIAAGTNHIIAERNTITGSIGVFSLYFSGENLAKRLGINAKELSVVKNLEPTYFHGLSASQQAQAQKLVDWSYQNFISSVATGLDLPENEVKKSANGRVWLGHEAFSRKLVQEIGGFAQALDAIRILAEIPDTEELILEIHKPGANVFSLSSRLVRFFISDVATREVGTLSALAKPYIKAIDCYRLHGIAQARLPFYIGWE